jgi:hypothetical protein
VRRDPVVVKMRSALESAVRTKSSSRQSPSTSATSEGLPLVPLLVSVPVAVSSVPRVQSSMVGVWVPLPFTICVVRSPAQRIDMFVPGVAVERISPVALSSPLASVPPAMLDHTSMPGTSARTSPIIARPVSRPE